jgi:hypothetical protein
MGGTTCGGVQTVEESLPVLFSNMKIPRKKFKKQREKMQNQPPPYSPTDPTFPAQANPYPPSHPYPPQHGYPPQGYPPQTYPPDSYPPNPNPPGSYPPNSYAGAGAPITTPPPNVIYVQQPAPPPQVIYVNNQVPHTRWHYLRRNPRRVRAVASCFVLMIVLAILIIIFTTRGFY